MHTTITPELLEVRKKEFIRKIVQFKDEETMLNHINQYLEFLKSYGIHFNHDIYEELKTYSTTNDLYERMLRQRVMDRDTFIMDINSLSDDDGIIDRIGTYLKEKYNFPSRSIQTNKKLIPSIYADLKKYIDDSLITNQKYKTAVQKFRKTYKIQQKVIEPVEEDEIIVEQPSTSTKRTTSGITLRKSKTKIKTRKSKTTTNSQHRTKTESKKDGGLLVVMFVSGLVIALVAAGISKTV